MLGAYLTWTFTRTLWEWGGREPALFIAAILLAALAVGAIGALIEIVLLRRIYRAPELFQLLATFGVVLMIQDIALAVWGPEDLPLPRPPWLRRFVEIAGSRFPRYDLILIFVGPAVLGLLWFLFQRTRFGVLVRAATQDREMVAALGVDQRVLFTGVFFLGSTLAGLGGGIIACTTLHVTPLLSYWTHSGELVFIAILGGGGSVVGPYLGAVVYELVRVYAAAAFPDGWQMILGAVLLLIILFAARGLWGIYEDVVLRKGRRA